MQVFNEPITSQQLSAVRHVTVSQCLNIFHTHVEKNKHLGSEGGAYFVYLTKKKEKGHISQGDNEGNSSAL